MAKEKKRRKKNDTGEIEKTVDPYTGELKPVPEDADRFIEVVPEETDDRRGRNYLLNEESSMDNYTADADADAIADESAHYTEDEDIEADFAERQSLAASGREELEEELDEYNGLSPEITAGDIDASWQTANASGEETLGGTVPTPDQDIVDNLGAAAGLSYRDDEPLNSDRKILDRDRNRWELNPASANDDENVEDENLEGDELDDFDEDDDVEEGLDELGDEIEDDEDLELEDEEDDDE